MPAEAIVAVVPNVALPVFAFYLLVGCNYIKEVIGCQLQHVLDNNMLAKHVVAFLLLYFLVVIARPEGSTRVFYNLLVSAGIYAWFIVTTRSPYYIVLPVLVLLLVSYVASIAKDSPRSEEVEKTTAERVQYFSAYTALAISLIGFGVYLVEKKREYGSRFRLRKFFSGNLRCRGYTPSSARVL